jgi:hypothetical protein
MQFSICARGGFHAATLSRIRSVESINETGLRNIKDAQIDLQDQVHAIMGEACRSACSFWL